MLKWLARKILKKELEKREEDYKGIRDSYWKTQAEYDGLQKKYTEDLKDHIKNVKELDGIIKSLQYQNDLMRQYYHLDQEPSEEIIAKMRIDLRCHELERENDRLNAMLGTYNTLLPIYVNTVAQKNLVGWY